MNLDDALRTRRSVRQFRADAPPDELIERILSAAITAPSASNKQPWRFIVVSRRDVIEQMASAVREQTAEIAAHVPEASVASFEAYGSYFTRFEQAPRVVVPIFRGHTVLSNLVGDGLAPDARERIMVMERDSGLVGTSLALMSLLLSAHELGLGASAMTGPLVASHRLREILRIPERWGIVAVVPVGYPDEEPSPTDRKSLEKVIRWVR